MIDTITVEEMIQNERRKFEEREELSERILPGEEFHNFCILGIYKTMEEASASLDWVRAWRSGS